MTPTTYVRNKEIRLSSTYVYHGALQEGRWIHQGKFYTDEEFDKMFPIDSIKIAPISKYNKGANSDKTKAWLSQ